MPNDTPDALPTLAQDTLGRRWVQATIDEPHTFDEILVTLLYAEEDGTSHTIGNGFVVYEHANAALCITASHNFEYIKQLQRRRRVQSHPSLPPDFALRGLEYLDTTGMHALYVRNKKPVFCKVDQINYQGNYDAAVFAIHFDRTPDTPEGFLGRAAIDLAMPQVGDEVALLGHELIQSDRGAGMFQLERRLQFFFGFVTGVVPGPARMGQSFCFETTIPIKAGLSGSPILKKPTIGGPMTVAGVASFDVSSQEAFTSFLVAGNSSATCLWPALALGSIARTENSEHGRFISLNELVQSGAIESKTEGVSVELNTSTGNTVIVYSDRRVVPPASIALTTPANPQIEMAVPVANPNAGV